MNDNAPVIVLVRPQMGENIGAVARAMANFGLTELRLVAPRDGWPNQRALEVSSGGEHIIRAAKLFADTTAALADIEIAYATTARLRDMEKRVLTPEAAMGEIAAYLPPPLRGRVGVGGETNSDRASITPPPNLPPQGGEGFKVALMFGPERTGLENEDVALVDAFVTIPTDPEHFSLNIAQSAVVMGYEWWKRNLESGIWNAENKISSPNSRFQIPDSLPLPAPKSDWTGMFDQLEGYLDDVDYWRVANKKPLMWQNLQNMLLRGAWSSQELRTFRGMLRLLFEKPRK